MPLVGHNFNANRPQKLLVTGGAGFIGSHFCKRAALEGHTIVVFDNLSTGHESFAKFGRLEVGDLKDSCFVHDTFEKVRPDVVVHFAAKALVGESMAQPLQYYHDNVVGTFNLIEASLRVGVEKFIFSSSCATYGTPTTGLIQESHPQLPINPYGQSKLMGERMLLDASRLAAKESAKRMRVALLRYFNVVGADVEGQLYEKHNPETHIVPLLMQALQDKKSFRINGDDYSTPDGTCIRDYVDVTDLAQVHLLAISELDQREELISNVGTGEGYSVKDVLRIFQEVHGQLQKVEVGPRRPGDPPTLVADSRHFRNWYHLPMKTLKSSIESVRPLPSG